jgi:hypothetical protein
MLGFVFFIVKLICAFFIIMLSVSKLGVIMLSVEALYTDYIIPMTNVKQNLRP